MHTPQFTYFNVWAQSSQRHALSLGASALLSAASRWDAKKIGRKHIPALCQHAELSLIKSTERDEQKHKKEDGKASWCSCFTKVLSHHRPLVHLPTSDVFWIIVIGERCWFRCGMLLSTLWSPPLREGRQCPGQECVIGNRWARFFFLNWFCSSVAAGYI